MPKQGGLYNKIIVSGEMFGTENSQVIVASGNFLIPAGSWIIAAVTGGTIQHQKAGTSTWINVYPANSGGFVVSDGVNMRILDGGSGHTALYYGIQ